MNETQFTLPDTVWAGTEHSLVLAREVHAAAMAGLFDGRPKDEEKERSYLLSTHGDVGVITIRGSLTNRDSWYNRYAGVTSYNEIRRALVEAANDSSIKAILLDIDSGGGSVAGVADVGNLIKEVSSVKTVYSFTDGQMCSAAYWLGCSADQVFTSQTAILGSIGVIATHTEYSEMFKKAGIGVTVVRAGEFKALLNSYEPATKKAIESLENQLVQIYNVFAGHVAESRGTTVAKVDQKMGQGREFLGDEAVAAGLADGIATFDKLLGRVQAKLLDTQSFPNNNSDTASRGLPMKRALTEADIAAIAAGAAPSAETKPAAEETGADPVVEPKAEAETKPAAESEAKPAAAAEPTDLVKFLQGQLAEAQTANVDLRVEIAGLKSKVTETSATQDALMKIAAQSLSNMKVALGLSAVDMTGMSATQLLAEHTLTAEKFAKAFKVGGVSAAASPTEAATPAVSPNHQAFISATNLKK